jgi:non-canonical purine NTP pyrophosphatase (RdgB/HAM1 family)
MNVTFITGNQQKADFLAKYLGHDIRHQKLDLEELQDLDLRKVAGHKARQAYDKMNSPVLVEDVSLTFEALGKLPGPFIKWFEQEIGLEGLCRLLDNYDSRSATAGIVYAYFDGKDHPTCFEGFVKGNITEKPRLGENSFGWNSIFVPEGSKKAYVEFSDEELQTLGFRTSTIYPAVRKFLANIDKG